MSFLTYGRILVGENKITDRKEQWSIKMVIHRPNAAQPQKVWRFTLLDEIVIPTKMAEECRNDPCFLYDYFSMSLARIRRKEFMNGSPPAVCAMCSAVVQQPILLLEDHWHVSLNRKVIMVNPAIFICESDCCHRRGRDFLNSISGRKSNKNYDCSGYERPAT